MHRRFFRLRLGGARRERRRWLRHGYVLAVRGEHGDRRVDRHGLGAFIDEDAGELALVHRFDFHGRLVGLDLGDDVAGAHLVADMFEPRESFPSVMVGEARA